MLAGAPDEETGYSKQHIDGIEVYLSDEIRSGSDGVVVTMGGWGPFRSITVEGAV